MLLISVVLFKYFQGACFYDPGPGISKTGIKTCNNVAFFINLRPMRRQPFRLRLLAFALLLIFSQKAGVGLCLHNIFHGNVSKSEKHKENKTLSFECSCKDDLSLPFLESSLPEIATLLIHKAPPFSLQHSWVTAKSQLAFFLRGPPARLA